MARYEVRPAKSILNQMKYIDGWFWCRYTLNPYNGCEHACVYCDARSDRYYLHKDFEETVYIKDNAPLLLEKKLKNARTLLPDVVAMGGTCDSYQPVEQEYKLSRSILELLKKYRYPVTISTKSDLILRDADLFEAIATQTFATIAFTITSIDPEVVAFLEPGAATTQKRLDAIRTLRELCPHAHIGVNFMPIVPMLEDTEENLEGVIKAAKEAGAQFILPAVGMTLRDSQAVFFRERLKEWISPRKTPEEVQRLLNTLDEIQRNEFSAESRKKYAQSIGLLCKISTQISLPLRAPRWYPPDFRNVNYRAAEVLINSSYFKQIADQPYKSELWAGLKIQNLSESIVVLEQRGELSKMQEITPEIRKSITPFLELKPKDSTLNRFLLQKPKNKN